MGRVFLYLGEEEFLKKEAIEKLRNSYGGRVDYYSFSPGEEAFNMEEIMRQARTKNLFSPRQIIVIRDIDKISLSDRELLIAYVRNPVEHTDLVLLTKLKMKKLNDSDFLWIKDLINEPALKTKEFFPLVDKDLQNWIVAEAGKYGKRISPPAVSLLISKLGNNTFLISQALEKTSLYINNKKIIEWNDLEPTIGKEITLDVYKMLNAFLKGNLVEGITILRDIHHFNVRPDKILGIIVAEWRKFYLAKKLLQEGVKYEQIKKELNLFYADIFFSNLNRITLEKIEKSLVELLSVDYAIKMGRTKPFFALELWFLKFFS